MFSVHCHSTAKANDASAFIVPILSGKFWYSIEENLGCIIRKHALSFIHTNYLLATNPLPNEWKLPGCNITKVTTKKLIFPFFKCHHVGYV